MNNGIIAIGAHPDDIELGCGASLTKLASKGFNVYSVVLSAGDKGNPVDFDRIKEAKNGLN
jgi:LmbE family N-acetylglucosaminyl deacetylase